LLLLSTASGVANFKNDEVAFEATAEELFEFRTQLKGAFDFGLRAETKAAFGQLEILV
jgi:hypothetical protein